MSNRFGRVFLVMVTAASLVPAVSGAETQPSEPCEVGVTDQPYLYPQQFQQAQGSIPRPPADHEVNAGLGSIPSRNKSRAELEAMGFDLPPGPRQSFVYPYDPKRPFTYMELYPSVVEVNRGDCVRWDFGRGYNSWHTITFIPKLMDVSRTPAVSLDDEAFKRYEVWRSDDKEGQNQLSVYNEGWIFGSTDRADWEFGGVRCGHSYSRSYRTYRWRPDHLKGCVLDGSKDVSSSTFEALFSMAHDYSFRVKIDLPPGEYRYFDLLHPGVEGRIRVVEGKPSNPSKDEIEKEIFRDTLEAERLFSKLDGTQTKDSNGKSIVHVGASTLDDTEVGPNQPSVQIVQFLPQTLRIAAGEEVRYVNGFHPGDEGFDPSRFEEVHGAPDTNTVTFTEIHPKVSGGFNCDPGACELQLPTGLAGVPGTPNCEFDEPNGGLPGAYGAWLAIRRCPPGSYFEATLSPYLDWETHAPGDEVLQGSYHNSGQMWDKRLPLWFRGRPIKPEWATEFLAKFPAAGTFNYFCLAHADFMRGKVEVS